LSTCRETNMDGRPWLLSLWLRWRTKHKEHLHRYTMSQLAACIISCNISTGNKHRLTRRWRSPHYHHLVIRDLKWPMRGHLHYWTPVEFNVAVVLHLNRELTTSRTCTYTHCSIHIGYAQLLSDVTESLKYNSINIVTLCFCLESIHSSLLTVLSVSIMTCIVHIIIIIISSSSSSSDGRRCRRGDCGSWLRYCQTLTDARLDLVEKRTFNSAWLLVDSRLQMLVVLVGVLVASVSGVHAAPGGAVSPAVPSTATDRPSDTSAHVMQRLPTTAARRAS